MNRLNCLVMLTVLLAASPAFPADPASVEQARQSFQRSKELYEDGDLAGALNELERSYRAVPNYKLLYNLGQINAQQQNHAGALKHFRKFLTEGGNQIPEARRSEVLKEIDKLRTRVADLTIVINEPGAEVSIDDVVVGQSPLRESIMVNAGKRKVSANLQNFLPVVRQVDVVGLDTPRLTIELKPLVSGPVITQAPVVALPGSVEPTVVVKAETPPPVSRFPVWIPWVGTAALGASTVVMGVLALQSSDQQRALLKTYGVDAATLSRVASTTATRALVTDILAGCTGAAAIGSLLFTLLRAPETAATASLQWSVGPGSFLVMGTF